MRIDHASRRAPNSSVTSSAADRGGGARAGVRRGASAARPWTVRAFLQLVLRQRRGRRPRRAANPPNSPPQRLSHLAFARRRRRGRALVRVFNPTLREHGYTSPHTVVEMVNDDMPFLVDSIGLALTPALADAAFPRASDFRGGARPRRRSAARVRGDAAARPRDGTQTRAPRIASAHRDRPHRRSRGAARRCSRKSKRSCATCARPAPIG